MRQLAVSSTILLLALFGVPSPAVEIEIEVVDGKGAPVDGLAAEDLQLTVGRSASGLEGLRYVDGLSETKLYIGAEMPPTDFTVVHKAVSALIETLPPDVEVSLAGAPFTSDKAKLREHLALGLDLARKGPDAGLVKIWDFAQGYLVQGKPVLDNYALLASQLAAVPGQKRVVLYRQSLELRQNGLDTREMTIRTGQLRQNDADMLGNEEDVERLGTIAALARVRFYTTNVSVNVSSIDDQGLNAVARHSGGKAVLGGSNAEDVLRVAMEDLPGYYVATIDPPFEGKGSRVNLKASVSGKGVTARLPRAFLLDFPGLEAIAGPREDLLALDEAAGKLPVRVERWVFRGPDGGPLIILSAGASVDALGSAPADKGLAVELALAGGIRAGDGWAPAAQRRSRQIFEKKAFANAQKRGDFWVDVTASGGLPGPGMHAWKTVLRDEQGKAFGAVSGSVGVHDLSRPMSTSDVLLTRRAIPLKPDTPAEPWGDLFDFGGSRLIPESTREFNPGEPVLFTYRLYNPPQEMLDSPPPVQLALFKDEQQLESFDGQGEVRVIPGRKEIQYVGSIQTKGLEPGEYLILSAVPGREDERQPYVEGAFRLVKK